MKSLTDIWNTQLELSHPYPLDTLEPEFDQDDYDFDVMVYGELVEGE